jgi:hypothetical protein
MRMNCTQITRAQGYYGKRRKERVYDHKHVVPPCSWTQGKGSMWSRNRVETAPVVDRADLIAQYEEHGLS